MLLAQVQVDPILAWCTAYGARAERLVKQEVYSRISSTDMMESLERFCLDNEVECPTSAGIGRSLAKMGFKKKNLSWGKEYEMYGVDSVSIMRPFVIRNEEFDLGFERDTECFIKEED